MNPASTPRTLCPEKIDLSKVPAFPPSLHKLMAALARDDASGHELERLIESDPALCAKALRMANSAFYGLATRAESAKEAVAILGLKTLSNIANAAYLAQCAQSFPGFDHAGFILRSLTRARAAELLAGRMGLLIQPHEAYNAALFTDIGLLPLAMQQAGAASPAHDGSDPADGHPGLGARLLRLWKLPEKYAKCAQAHHDTSPADELACLCCIASELSYCPKDQVFWGPRGSPFPCADLCERAQADACAALAALTQGDCP